MTCLSSSLASHTGSALPIPSDFLKGHHAGILLYILLYRACAFCQPHAGSRGAAAGASPAIDVRGRLQNVLRPARPAAKVAQQQAQWHR